MTNATLHASAHDGARIVLGHDGESISDAPALCVTIDRRRIERFVEPAVTNGADRSTITGRLEGTAVVASWAANRLAGMDSWEFTLVLTNHGDEPVAVTRMDPVSLIVGNGWRTSGYRSAWGDEYRPVRGSSSHDLILESRSGRSSNGAVPWLGLERTTDGTAGDGIRARSSAAISLAVAWSGNWHIHAMAGGHVTAGISPWRLLIDLAPGASVTAPGVVVTISDDLDAASVITQRAVADDWLPRSAASEALPVEWNHWWPYEDVEITEALIAQNAAIAGEIGVDVVTVDAGWFGAADAGSDWQLQRGDWHLVNTERFPSGLAALGNSIRAGGPDAGMWIEAEAVGRLAALRRDRPELLALAVEGLDPDPSYRFMTVSVDEDDPTFLGYVCLGSAAGREHMLESMSALVTATSATWIKLDFNIDPDAGCTRTDHGHGAGDGLFRHVEGLYSVLDEFRARHPEVLLESCSSGGLRLDLGLARHVHAFFLSDPDYTEHHLQVLWGVRHLLPPVGILHWSWSQWRGEHPASQRDWPNVSVDEFERMLRAAMLHRFGVSIRLPDLRPELIETLRHHIEVFHEVMSPLVLDGVLVPISDPPLRDGLGERAPVIQLTGVGEQVGRSVVAAFVLDGGVARAAVTPVGIDSTVMYRVTDLGSGARRKVSGADIVRRGLDLDDTAGAVSWLLLLEPTD
jgi:alpha-galactosidase